MAKRSFDGLKALRVELLGYTRGAVARLSGLPEARLVQIEDADQPPAGYETEALARLYGVDADCLGDLPIVVSDADAIQTLALLDEFKEISDAIKARIVATANAARDLVVLRRRAGEATPLERYKRAHRQLNPPKPGAQPFEQGNHHAKLVRRQLGLGNKAIPSLRDLVDEAFPEIAVLFASLGGEGPAGVTFADRSRGPTIVLNLDGKNQNPAVRRFSFAHELCHLLVDWNRHQPLAAISGFFTESALETEQRANAFAVRLLCPESALRQTAMAHDPIDAVQRLMDEYGLHYSAARLYLRMEAGVMLPPMPPTNTLGAATRDVWALAEAPVGMDRFPLQQVPPERRTLIARYAARLHSLGDLSRDGLAQALGVTPDVDLEAVMGFFALDLPSDA